MHSQDTQHLIFQIVISKYCNCVYKTLLANLVTIYDTYLKFALSYVCTHICTYLHTILYNSKDNLMDVLFNDLLAEMLCRLNSFYN